MPDQIFACVDCGQVYLTGKPPKECMRHNCSSTTFKEIQKEDVIDMHDVMNTFIEKLLAGDYD